MPPIFVFSLPTNPFCPVSFQKEVQKVLRFLDRGICQYGSVMQLSCFIKFHSILLSLQKKAEKELAFIVVI